LTNIAASLRWSDVISFAFGLHAAATSKTTAARIVRERLSIAP